MSLFGKAPTEEPQLDEDVLDVDGAEDEANASMTLSGVGGGLDESDLSAMDQQASGGIWANNAMVVVLVIAVGGIGIWGMRFMMRDSGQGLVDQDVVTRIENFIALQRDGGPALAQGAQAAPKEDEPDIQETIRLMSEPWREQQVRREELAKNPFVVGVKKPEEKKDNREELARQREKMLNEVQRFNLEGVMGGKRPVAVIDGELYQQGQPLGTFTVSSISDSSVYLSHPEFPEEIIELVVEKDPVGSRRR